MGFFFSVPLGKTDKKWGFSSQNGVFPLRSHWENCKKKGGGGFPFFGKAVKKWDFSSQKWHFSSQKWDFSSQKGGFPYQKRGFSSPKGFFSSQKWDFSSLLPTGIGSSARICGFPAPASISRLCLPLPTIPSFPLIQIPPNSQLGPANPPWIRDFPIAIRAGTPWENWKNFYPKSGGFGGGKRKTREQRRELG